jgi:hypothetical protein
MLGRRELVEGHESTIRTTIGEIDLASQGWEDGVDDETLHKKMGQEKLGGRCVFGV